MVSESRTASGAANPWDIEKLMELSRWAATQRRVREGAAQQREGLSGLDRQLWLDEALSGLAWDVPE